MEEINRAEIGRKGEDFSAAYYQKNGYLVTARNFHSRYGEIDLIAENEDTIIIVEVKTRHENSLVDAREFVDRVKQRKIMLTTLSYLSGRQDDKAIRFDVFEVLHNGKRMTRFRVNEGAFEFDEALINNIYF